MRYHFNSTLIILTFLILIQSSLNYSFFKAFKFSWSSCGTDDDPIQFSSLIVEPDPIQLPGNLSLGFRVNVSQNLNSDLKLSLKVAKKVGVFWVEIPCEHDLGSCEYDACEFIKNFVTCPEVWIKNNLPCQCPVSSGDYALPISNVGPIKLIKIPKWLENGSYYTKTVLTDSINQLKLCLELYFSIKAVQNKTHSRKKLKL